MLNHILHHRMFILGFLFLVAALLTLLLGQPGAASGAGLFQSPTTEPEVFDSPLAAPVTEEKLEVDLVSGTLISPLDVQVGIPLGKIPAYWYDLPVIFKDAP